MKVQINIEKKHFIVIIFLLAITVFGIAQPTPNPGHSLTEVPGATRNCLTNPTDQWCLNATGSSFHGGQGWNGADVSFRSAMSANTINFAGLHIGLFCRSDGTNCQPATSSNPEIVIKRPSTFFCFVEAFYCGQAPIDPVSGSPKIPFWDGTRYRAGSSGAVDCGWVLCRAN